MITTLDPNDPAQAHALERLTTEQIGWLTTVDPAGVPHSSAIWFLWGDGELLIYSRTRAPRNRNIAEHPAVSFNLDTADGGDDVVTVVGTARIDHDAPPADRHPVYLAKYAARITGYDWTPEWFAEAYSVPIRVTPTRFRLG